MRSPPSLALNDRRGSQRVRAGGSAEGDRASQAQDVRPVVAVSLVTAPSTRASQPSVRPFGALCHPANDQSETRRFTTERLLVRAC